MAVPGPKEKRVVITKSCHIHQFSDTAGNLEEKEGGIREEGKEGGEGREGREGGRGGREF